MQSCGEEIVLGFEKVCAIAPGRKPSWFKRFLVVLINLLPQTKPSTLAIVEFSAIQIQHFYLFSDKAIEFIDLNKRTGSRLGLVGW
jgi:hypothetical protein